MIANVNEASHITTGERAVKILSFIDSFEVVSTNRHMNQLMDWLVAPKPRPRKQYQKESSRQTNASFEPATKKTSQWNNVSSGARGPESRMSEHITAVQCYIATGKDKEINHVVHEDDDESSDTITTSPSMYTDLGENDSMAPSSIAMSVPKLKQKSMLKSSESVLLKSVGDPMATTMKGTVRSLHNVQSMIPRVRLRDFHFVLSLLQPFPDNSSLMEECSKSEVSFSSEETETEASESSEESEADDVPIPLEVAFARKSSRNPRPRRRGQQQRP